MTVDLKRLETRVTDLEGALGVKGVDIPQAVLPLVSCETWARQYAWPVGSVMVTAEDEEPDFGDWTRLGSEIIDPQTTVYFWKRNS